MELRWRICYVDESSFSNAEGEPQDAPGGGVAAIAQEDDVVGIAIHHQEDFYAFDEQWGGWYGLDYFGLAQYLMRPGLKIVKMGDNMTTDAYLALIRRLQDDPGLPARSARYPWERPNG